jgi:chromosome segregation ATPase
MARTIFSWILIILGSLFLLLSVFGVVAAWIYNEPLTQKATTQLKDIDRELALAQATLKSSEEEMRRALRILDASEAALEKLTEKTDTAESLFERIQNTLDDRLLPELKTTRSRIVEARATLENLQSAVAGINSFIPGVNLGIPDDLLTDLIASTVSMDAEIANVEVLATQASLFVSDTSYLLGGDLTQTRQSLETFLTAIQEYQTKVTGWREQAADLIEDTPRWVDQASIGLTIFLLWFGISQFGLILHGLNLRRGGDPLRAMRRTEVVVREDGLD